MSFLSFMSIQIPLKLTATVFFRKNTKKPISNPFFKKEKKEEDDAYVASFSPLSPPQFPLSQSKTHPKVISTLLAN